MRNTDGEIELRCRGIYSKVRLKRIEMGELCKKKLTRALVT